MQERPKNPETNHRGFVVYIENKNVGSQEIPLSELFKYKGKKVILFLSHDWSTASVIHMKPLMMEYDADTEPSKKFQDTPLSYTEI